MKIREYRMGILDAGIWMLNKGAGLLKRIVCMYSSIQMPASRIPVLYSLFFILYSSCDGGSVDSKKMREAMAERKVYHINDAQLIAGAEAAGQVCVHYVDSVLTAKVGRQPTVPCPALIKPDLDSLRKEGLDVARMIYSAWKPGPQLPKVKQVLEAVYANQGGGNKTPPNIQKDGQGGFHYVQALTVSGSNCLACHKQWAIGQEVGIYSLTITSKPAAKAASRGMKGM